MTEQKKAKIQKSIIGIEIALALLLLVYLIYGAVTQSANQTIFNGLSIALVVVAVVLNDFVEPYLLKRFDEMDDFAKEAYKKYVLWDVAGWVGLLIFLLTFMGSDSTFMLLGAGLYFIGTRQKRQYRGAFMGTVTKEDVEAAKALVVDAEAVELEDTQDVTEE